LLLQDGSTAGKYVLKITDFNSAKRIGNCPGSSLMLSERGTNFYSAPELRFGRIWNERVDIWASGMCFYFMRHAMAPFNIQEPGQANVFRAGHLPRITWAGFSKMARALLLQCLTVEMRDRPAAMELVVHPLFSDRQLHGRPRARSCEDLCRRHSGCSSSSEGPEDVFLPMRAICSDGSVSQKLGLHTGETTTSPTSSWKELRNHSDALQRLANMRCERALNEQETPDSPFPDTAGPELGGHQSSQSPAHSRDSGSRRGSFPDTSEPLVPGCGYDIGESLPQERKIVSRDAQGRKRRSRERVDGERFFTTHAATTEKSS